MSLEMNSTHLASISIDRYAYIPMQICLHWKAEDCEEPGHSLSAEVDELVEETPGLCNLVGTWELNPQTTQKGLLQSPTVTFGSLLATSTALGT